MKKKPIPSAVRSKVWNTYIGVDKAFGKCFCDGDSIIHINNFECGHVQAESKGGDLKIENLRPICKHCNVSMGSMNMIEFMNTYGFDIGDSFYKRVVVKSPKTILNNCGLQINPPSSTSEQKQVREDLPPQQQSISQRPPPQQQSISQRLPSQQQSISQRPPSQQSISQRPPSQQSISQRPPSRQSVSQIPSSQQSMSQRPPSRQSISQRTSSQQQSISQRPSSQQQSISQRPPSRPSSQQQSISQRPSSQQQSISQKPSSSSLIDQINKLNSSTAQVLDDKEREKISRFEAICKKFRELQRDKLRVIIKKYNSELLKEICEEYKLKVSGTKEELIDRILEGDIYFKYNDLKYDEYVEKQMNSLTLKTLKMICRNYEMVTKGTKAEIVKRMIDTEIIKDIYEIIKK
jgi:colicin import membrane protein